MGDGRAASTTTRRRVLAGLGATGLGATGLGAAALGVDGARSALADGGGFDPDRDDGVTDGFRQTRVRYVLPRNRRFHPRRLLVAYDGGAVAARLPRYADAFLDNRVQLSGVPLVGDLFKGGRANAFVRPERQVGVVRRDDDTLVADLRGRALSRRLIRRLLASDAMLLTRPPLEREAVSMRLPVAFSAVAQPAPDALSGPVIGGVYDADDAMLLSPPLETFFGRSLF